MCLQLYITCDTCIHYTLCLKKEIHIHYIDKARVEKMHDADETRHVQI